MYFCQKSIHLKKINKEKERKTHIESNWTVSCALSFIQERRDRKCSCCPKKDVVKLFFNTFLQDALNALPYIPYYRNALGDTIKIS